jgi:hypothetical protein
MAEGLAAIGLAGNIIQFISFASVLVSKSREIHQSASGVSSELVDVIHVAKDVRNFSSQLLANPHVPKQLYDIAKCCNAVAQELLSATAEIQKHRRSSTNGATQWRSFRKALKCIWKKEQIDELKSRLVLLRDQVSLHLISDTK